MSEQFGSGQMLDDDGGFGRPARSSYGRGYYEGRGGHGHPSEFARAAAEALGTFMLVLAIMLALLFTMLNGNSWFVVALVAGMTLAGAMAAVGHVSGGGDFNPAVTIGKAVAGRISPADVLPKIAGQIVGAAAAALVALAIIPETFANALQFATRGEFLATTASGFGTRSPLSVASNGLTTFSWGTALLAEILFTALFVAVVLGATRKRARRSGMAPLTVGLTFGAFLLLTWPISNGGLNPARAFGSVMFAGDRELWAQLWVFVVGPILGALLAGVIYRAFAGAAGGPIGATKAYARPGTLPGVYAEPVPNYADANVPAPWDEPASEDAVENEVLISEPVEQFGVAEDVVDEGGDEIISGEPASVAADILEADERH